MATTYRTREGDVLDYICWKHYGTTSVLEKVLDANMNLAEYGTIFPSGVIIKLPEISIQTEVEAESLWD